MKVFLGSSKFPDKSQNHLPVYWNSDTVINGHMILVGASGTGKTFRLRYIMNEMLKQNPNAKFHVIDVHGDIQVPGSSVVRFSETTHYGLNPLKINPDPDFGGVRKRVRNFISTLKRTSNALGSKQEATLVNVLQDLYRANGFLIEDHRTWSLNVDPRRSKRGAKRQPTIADLKRFTDYKLKQMILGAGSVAVGKLEQLQRKFRSLDRANTKNMGGDDVALEGLKGECKDLYSEYIDSIETGREIDDLIKYNSRDVMQSVYERIVTLESSGIFKAEAPPFDEDKRIWNYDIRALNGDEQKMFVDVLLEDLFMEAKQRGERPFADTFIIIDEAHKFVSEDEEHIVNLIAKEARKFGIGLVLASQSLTHFPEDIIANTSTKIILGLDEMYHDSAARKLRVEAKRFGFIQPRKTALVQVKETGSLVNKYIDVYLPNSRDTR